MTSKEITSKVLDDAREKIAKDIYFEGDHFEEGTFAEGTWRDMPDGMRKRYLDRADQILALSGTTDIKCEGCKGIGHHGVFNRFGAFLYDEPCPQCDNGVIKYPWKVRVVLENGELPEFDYSRCRGENSADCQECSTCNGFVEGTEEMFTVGYRQVVE